MSTNTAELPEINDIADSKEQFYDNEDGIYPGVPEDDYHEKAEASSRCSQTVLSELIDKSPCHAKTKRDGEFDLSSSQKFGTALHSAVLTPDLFQMEYGQKEQCAGIKGDGDRCSYDGKHPWVVENDDEDGTSEGIRWFCSTHEPEAGDSVRSGTALGPAELETLTEKKMDKIGRIRESLRMHPAANNLLTAGDGAEELTVLWTWEEGTRKEVRCKSRIDRLAIHPDLGPIAVDLKTTRTAKPGTTPQTFGYSAAKYGYHRQAAFYSRALAAHGVPVEHYFIVAVEKSEPHDVVVSEVKGDAMALGDDEITKGLRLYAECKNEGVWPGYRRTVEPIKLPSWAYDQHDW